MEPELTRQKTEHEQRAEAEALFMSIGEGVIVTDERARISRINKTALRILGYKEKDLLGQWFPDVIIAEDEKSRRFNINERPIAQVFLSGKIISSRAFYYRKNGTKLPVFLTVSPVLLRGKPIGAIEIFRDISHELSLEKAKDEFVAIASHQLRTPATAVKQYVGLLLEGYSDPLTDGQKLFLERAYESNERQLQLVQEILQVTQVDLEKVVLRPAKHDVRGIILNAISSVEAITQIKKQKIITNLPTEPVLIRADADQLRGAIENLLENASNYTYPRKRITVSCKSTGQQIQIIVRDQGVGIDEADFPRLFQKFSRIPNALSVEANGTGLGLYWAAKIIELHGGRIDVKSTVGKGSSFIIILPSGI